MKWPCHCGKLCFGGRMWWLSTPVNPYETVCIWQDTLFVTCFDCVKKINQSNYDFKHAFASFHCKSFPADVQTEMCRDVLFTMLVCTDSLQLLKLFSIFLFCYCVCACMHDMYVWVSLMMLMCTGSLQLLNFIFLVFFIMCVCTRTCDIYMWAHATVKGQLCGISVFLPPLYKSSRYRIPVLASKCLSSLSHCEGSWFSLKSISLSICLIDNHTLWLLVLSSH